jgi:hypothetical protein
MYSFLLVLWDFIYLMMAINGRNNVVHNYRGYVVKHNYVN